MQNGTWARAALVAIGIGVSISTAVVGGMVGAVLSFKDLDKRVAVIESNRFTSRDWYLGHRELQKELNALSLRIGRVEDKLDALLEKGRKKGG